MIAFRLTLEVDAAVFRLRCDNGFCKTYAHDELPHDLRDLLRVLLIHRPEARLAPDVGIFQA